MGTIADKTSALANTKADIKAALQEQGQQVSDVFSTYGDAIRAIAPGVSSFNGRTGEVTPGSEDYSASMIKFTDGQTFQQKYDDGQLTGPAGANGSNGQDGEDGGYYKPAVDGSGNLTWTASKSGMPAVSGANIKGATGPAGTNGTDGKDATINGVNALTLEVVEGAGIVGTQTGTNFKIDATELFQSVSDGKSAVAAAITDKGVTTAADATFQQMAANIGQIQTGTDTSDATATAGDILSGKTAYGAAGKLTGTIPSQNATTITPGTTAKTAIAAGTYAAGAATVAGDANLVAGNIKNGVSIFGVAGSFAGGGENVNVSIELPFMPIEFNIYYTDGGTTYKNLYLAGSGGSISVLNKSLVFIAASNSFGSSAETSGGVSAISYPEAPNQYQLFFVSGAGTISL